MKLSVFKLLLTSLFLSFLISCISLKKVNDYSSNSLKSLKKFEDIGYSFTKSCNTRCEIEQMEKGLLFKEGCDCKSNKAADSVTLILYNSIIGYFEGLTKLSDNDLINYKFDAITNALKVGQFGDITINKDHVDSYSKISKILLKAFTDSYRKKKISIYIEEANEPIQNLLRTLDFNLEANLSKKLEVQKERITSYYFDLSKDSNVSFYEKKKIIEEYNTNIAEIESKKKQILVFGKGLKSIGMGHQKLFESRKSLTSKEVIEMLTQYASDLQDIITEFNKLKNEN